MKVDKNIESEANLFAMLLLMPKKFISEDLDRGFDLGSDEDINRLSKKYGVSKTALAIRIAYFIKYKN
ncbi:MAG: ImmA/IrrE family metallo-endopeptidase [Bacteroidota bacterium]